MIEINNTLTSVLFYQGLIKHENTEHKDHHVQFVKNINKDTSELYCIDCEKTFTSSLSNM